MSETIDWGKMREEFTERLREWNPEEPGTKFRVEVHDNRTWEEEMWDRRREFRRDWWMNSNRFFPVKAALDDLKMAGKLLEILLRHDRLSPEALGFTSRKVGNLIASLELLKMKLDDKQYQL